MYLVYDISNNGSIASMADINNSKFLLSTDNINNITEMMESMDSIPGPGSELSSKFNLFGYCLFSNGYRPRCKYMVIDSNFSHTNLVLISFIRNYKISLICF